METVVFLVAAVFNLVLGGEVLISRRIIGGKPASHHEYLYQVSVKHKEHHYCGGSIIAPSIILTAGHCVYNKTVEPMSVHVGSKQLYSGGKDYDVDYYICHEKFDPILVINDIALLKLYVSIKFTTEIQPVALNTQYVSGNVNCVASGWGFTTVPVFADTLQQLNLKTVDWNLCRNLHANISNLPVMGSNICTFTKIGEGTCIGDSGGPLVANNKQIGIISWGYGCAGKLPMVYTRISSFIEWIEYNKQTYLDAFSFISK